MWSFNMVRGRPKKDDRQKLMLRLQREVQKAQWVSSKPPRRTKTLLLQEKVMADTRIIGTQNDRIKELCELIDETKAKLGNALAELEEYRALFFGVHRLVTAAPPRTMLRGIRPSYKTTDADAGVSVNTSESS
jgi:hypothetical protein